MDVKRFVSNFKNHPVLFIGSGFSIRYLENAFNWDSLLSHISFELHNKHEPYLDIKARNMTDNIVNFSKIATELEEIFEREATKDRDRKFKRVNDIFYSNMKENKKLSRIKIYIAVIKR